MGTSPRRRIARLFGAPTAALALAAVISACGASNSSTVSSGSTAASSPTATAAASGSGVVNWAYSEDNPNWDPVVVGATGATEVLSLIYEPLFTLNPAGQIEPALATAYKYNAAGTQVTVTLRPGLTFQDGSPLDAAAVAYDIHRAQTQTNSALKADYSEIGSTTVLSKTQIRLNLKQKDYQIPYILANRDGLISSEKAAKAGLSKLNDSDPVGAGPFEVTKLVPDASVTLKKFPGYWDAKDIHVNQVNLSLNVDPSTVLSGGRRGSTTS
jgi:peptide/nickel transport system substrate-binding protein